ncbi:MAG TPA: trypsin-like serine protease [Labilithrix sp.]|nr:trypsin-like serine protease [Labilithrix sp.]
MAVVSLLSPLACGKAPDGGTTEADIVGGVPADDSSLDAVGALVYKDYAGNWTRLCSATLIAPTVILTAKHCAMQKIRANPARGILEDSDLRLMDHYKELSFGVGSKISSLKDVVRVDSVEWCKIEGGYGVGCDVAVYHLAEAIVDVPPLAVREGPLGDELIGSRMTVIGYGEQTPTAPSADSSRERRQGTMTLRALRGAPLKSVFATVDAYLDANRADEGEAYVQEHDAELREEYEKTLLDDYEAFLSRESDDSTTCWGDSGGPLLSNVGGALVIQGVVSGGWDTPNAPCKIGGIFAVFGPEVRGLVGRTLQGP